MLGAVALMSDQKIGWTVREYIGTEIYLNEEDLKANHRMLKPPKVGDEILAPTLGGWVKAVVKDGKGLYAEAGRFIWPLALSDDDRHCWIAHGMINVAALKKLKLIRNKE